MARRRNTIAQFVSFDMTAMATRIQGMTEEQLGAWWLKAVINCCSGCIDPTTDPFVKEQYERSAHRMKKRQEIDAAIYRNRQARKNSASEENDQVTTTNTKISTNNPCNTGTQKQELCGEQACNALADSASRTSRASALEDADIREDSGNLHSGSNAVVSESATSSKTLATTPDESTNEPTGSDTQTRTGGDSLSGCDSMPVSHSGKPPVRTLSLLPPPEKKAYGTCKNVLLTDAEGKHLREVYKEDLPLAIEILDAALENSSKLSKKYRNHAAVLRKGNWVYNEVVKTKTNEQRLANANSANNRRTFQQMDREDRSRWLTTSMFDTEAVNE